MLHLIKKAKWVFIIVIGLFLLSYLAGFVAGKADWVDSKKLSQSKFIKFSSNLEYKVPGYGHLLKIYKDWHNKLRNKYLSNKDHWGMRVLIFINNFVVANVTMIVRSVMVLPLTLSIPGKFFQGAIFAQIPDSGRIWGVFFSEFSGYLLTICAGLTLSLWFIFHKLFGFAKRSIALIAGLKLLGLTYLVSGVGMLIGSIIETNFIMDFMSQLYP